MTDTEELLKVIRNLMDFGNRESESSRAKWAMDRAREALRKHGTET